MTAVLGAGLTRLELRTDGGAIYPDSDPTVGRSVRDRELFRDPEQVVILATAASGSAGFNTDEGLAAIVRLHRSLQAVEETNSRAIRSYASLPDPDPSLPLGTVRTALDARSESAATISEMRQRLDRLPPARGLLASTDGRRAAFYVVPSRDYSRGQLVAALEEWSQANATSSIEIELTGPVTAEVALGRTVLLDLAWLVPLMVIVVSLLLFASLRSIAGVLIPMAAVLCVLVATLGTMGWLGVPITLVTTILPVVLMTMAVTDEIHLLEALDAQWMREGTRDATDSTREALEAAVGEVARPIALTTLTTSLAFLSFLTSSMEPIRHFGVFTAFGIAFAMLLTFTLVPALIVTLPVSWLRRPQREPTATSFVPFAHRTGKFWIRHDRTALAAGACLVFVATVGVAKLEIQDSWIENFDPESEIVRAERGFNESFWGSYRFDVVITSEQHGYFETPEAAALSESISAIASRAPHVGGVLGYVDSLEAVGRVLGLEGSLEEWAPEEFERSLGAARALRSRTDLDHYLARDGGAARVRLFVKDPDYSRGVAVQTFLDEELAKLSLPAGARVHMSGELPSAVAVVRAIVTNQLRSIGWTVAAVFLVLLWALDGFRRAAIAMVPLLAALVLILGAMGGAGFALGIASSMFAALAVGVGIDFSLHTLHAYDRHRMLGDSHEVALSAALSRTGRAIAWNVLVLALGFLMLTVSALRPNHSLGFLLSASMVVCYVATLAFLPRLLRWQSESGA